MLFFYIFINQTQEHIDNYKLLTKLAPSDVTARALILTPSPNKILKALEPKLNTKQLIAVSVTFTYLELIKQALKPKLINISWALKPHFTL